MPTCNTRCQTSGPLFDIDFDKTVRINECETVDYPQRSPGKTSLTYITQYTPSFRKFCQFMHKDREVEQTHRKSNLNISRRFCDKSSIQITNMESKFADMSSGDADPSVLREKSFNGAENSIDLHMQDPQFSPISAHIQEPTPSIKLSDATKLKCLSPESPPDASNKSNKYTETSRDPKGPAKQPKGPTSKATDYVNLFIQMEYGFGMTLEDYMKNTSFSINKIEGFFIFNQMVDGITYIHSGGFIHRDLKPANILLTDGPDEAP